MLCFFVSQCKCLDPKNQGKPAASCGSAQYKGDGNCDDDNNNKGCDFDGGDCCAKSVQGGEVRITTTAKLVNTCSTTIL